jgi:MoxR-like ATPase
MLPEGEFVFLDELFNANSAILNNLLTVLNERIYRRGSEVHQLPLLSLFAASNHLPDDDALRALFDRFLLRCHVDNLKRDQMQELLHAGWELERAVPLESTVSARELRALARQVYDVDLDGVVERYADIASKVRDLGVALTDRRAVKVLKLVAASAVLCGRRAASVSDFWVFRYVWDREEQIAPLTALVAGVIEPYAHDSAAHPLTAVADRVDGEELARQLDAMATEIKERKPGLAAMARLRERLTDLADRAAWLADDRARRHLLDRVSDLLKILG